MTPPVLLSINPPDSSLETRITKLELTFNKYMEVQELEKNLEVAPFLNINPSVISYGKRIEIKIADTLPPNTTYRLSLGNALVDNREANPYKNFVYVFSTGSYFDSLQLKGRVFDAATGRPDTASIVMLYNAGENDSALVRHKPVYATKVNNRGYFSFHFLPQKTFRVYALQDENKNYIYDMGHEKVAFLGETVVPAMEPDSLVFPLFREAIDTSALANTHDSLKAPDPASAKDARAAKHFAGRVGRSKIGYEVLADTGSRLRTFELTKPLTIELYKELSKLDTGKVYLSYDNGGIEVEALQQLRVTDTNIQIHTQWQPDKVYTLRLVKGWAKDTAGAELPPGKYFFRTKQVEDYGTIRIHIDKLYLDDSLVLFVYKGADSIYQKPITDSIVTLSLLQPGQYGMRIIVDANKNGKWDEGAFFKKIQPEQVIPYDNEMILKAGWESDIDFLAPKPPPKAEEPGETATPEQPAEGDKQPDKQPDKPVDPGKK